MFHKRWITKIKRVTRRLSKPLLLLLAGIVILLLTAPPFPVAELHENDASLLLLDCEGTPVAYRVNSADEKRIPIEYDAISPWVIQATVAAEDQRFWSHRGVDPVAVIRASCQNLYHLKRISGASTLSMQSMRLITPSPRTWQTKLRESLHAFELESMLDKQTIIELYLNRAPYGGNIIGIEAAAQCYFGKPAGELSLGEAALLAGVPQSPSRFRPDRHLPAALRRRRYVLSRMEELGYATHEEIDRVEKQFLLIVPRRSMTTAPRFADFAAARAGQRKGRITTTLNPRIQNITELCVRKCSRRYKESGIDGMAAVVVSVRGCSLAAMVGSARPDDPITGEINAAQSLRQPGSLLKPFIYCAAYSKGIITPASIVYDTPTTWHGYRPENYDRTFRGAISASEALRSSRNVPAVKMLDRIGVSCLWYDMQRVGVKPSGPQRRYGLSLALGTAEARLTDLTAAYTVLARLGTFRKLRCFADDETGETARVYSPGAVWLTLSSMPGNVSNGLVWKTGTSWNHRDAWSVAITPEYAVGVWCGRLSGEGHPALIGSKAALPIALDITCQLASGRGWQRPSSVGIREICSMTGTPPGESCTHLRRGEYLRGVSCDIQCHRHHTASAPPKENIGIRIISPGAGSEYVLPGGGIVAGRVLELTANAEKPDEKIAWYLDEAFIGFTTSGVPLPWEMQKGNHRLTAAGMTRGQASVTFSVTSLE